MKLIGKYQDVKTPEEIKFEEELNKMLGDAKRVGLCWGMVLGAFVANLVIWVSYLIFKI